MFDFVTKFYDAYGFQLLVVCAVIFLFAVMLYNFLSGRKGTFNNRHVNLMWNLLQAPNGSSGSNEDDDVYEQTPGTRAAGPFESKGEAECRRVLRALTGRSFDKSRPSFLKNNITNANLELDCFDADMRLAVEYNGRQHYEYCPYFHSSKESFYNIRYRDDMKKRLCDEAGVKLIVVPYTVDVKDIERYLRDRI